MKKIYLLVLFFLGIITASAQTADWDGDGYSGNFTYSENWYGNSIPSTGSSTDLNFNVKNNSAQTSLYYDFAWTDFRSIYYLSTFNAGLTLGGNGNGINFYGKVENASNYKQDINIPLSYKGAGLGELNAVNGDFNFLNSIYNDNNKSFNLYFGNNKVLSLSGVRFVGNSTVFLNMKNSAYGILKINNNLDATSFSGGINVERGELWFNEGKSTNGGILKIGNGDSNVAKLYINDADGGTTINNGITIPAGSTNSYIGAFNTSGTNIFSGEVNLNANATIEGWNGGTILFQNLISGTGNLTFANNPGITNTNIKISSFSSSGSAEIKPLTTLLLAGSDIFNDASKLILSGGTFSNNGYNETLGQLDLQDNSTIALSNSVQSVKFAASNGVSWSSGKTLTITGWTGTAGTSGTAGKIFFGSGTGTLTSAQLANINFAGYTNGAVLLSTGELVPDITRSISTSSISGSPFCLGGTVSVPYTITGTFNSGNTFTAQLSDASGSFASPTTIGTLASTSSGTITATLPANSLYGTAYKIRVVSNNPSIIGTDNGAGLTINAVGFANLETASSSICIGNNITNGLVTGRVYIGSLTDTSTGENSNIKVEFGYGTTSDPTTGWTWTAANFKEDAGNDDRYTINNFGSALSAGTYKYTFRYRIGNSCEWKYGGYNGGFYNGTTNLLGTLTVNPAVTFTQTLTNTEADFVCADGSFIKYTPNIIGGTWSSDNTKVTLSTDPTTYEVTVTGVAMGSPSLTYTLNSCSVSKVITVTPAITFANIQLPKGLYGGPDVTVYAQVVAPGATGTDAGAFANTPPHNYVVADLGYSLDVATSNASFATGWTWQSMALNLASLYNQATNDEYQLNNFGAGLDDNLTYYYASRFRMKGSTKYTYGGTDGVDSTNSGGILNFTTYLCGILNVQAIVWDGTQWTVRYDGVLKPFNSEPTEGYNVEIAGDTNPPPTFSARKLTINNNVNLVIPALQYVKVVDAIINNNVSPSTATLSVKSDGNLIQVNPVAANVGNITAERDVTNMNNVSTQMDYVYWSSPVSGQVLKGSTGFSPGTPDNRFFYYSEYNDRFYETGDSHFQPGRGYAIRAEDGLANGYSKTYKFTGTPNNGDISWQITKSSDNPIGTEHGFNLVGNPYPSNINFNEFYTGNSSEIINSVWFWTNNNFTASQQGSGYNGNNYAVFNGTGGNAATSNPSNPLDITDVPNGIIKVGQAFLIRKKVVGNGTLYFKNSYGLNHDLRVSSSGTFFQKENSAKNRFWIKLISPANMVNTQLIGYIPGATNAYEQDFDAEILGMSSDVFYSKVEDKNLLIQGKGDFINTDKVELGANFFENGTYTIALDHAEGIFDGSQPIYLKDKQRNTIVNLSETAYQFAASQGVDNNRFEIIYQQILATNGNELENLVIYREGNDFIVKSQSKKITDLEVFDASGRMVYKVQPHNTKAIINSEKLNNGVYILKVDQSGEITTKKVIK